MSRGHFGGNLAGCVWLDGSARRGVEVGAQFASRVDYNGRRGYDDGPSITAAALSSSLQS